MRQLKRIVIHHSASPLVTTVEDIRHWHRTDNGWPDIGYHYVIHSDGSIHPGRPVWRMGAHAQGANRDSIGVCLVGNNLEPEQRWTKLQLLGLQQLLTALRIIFGPMEVHPHYAVGTTATACPGLTDDQWHAMTFPLTTTADLSIVRGECGGA